MENLTQKRKVEAENETFFSRGEIAWIAPSCTFLRSEESPDVSEVRPCGATLQCTSRERDECRVSMNTRRQHRPTDAWMSFDQNP